MKTPKLFMAALLACLTIGFASCDDNNNDNNDTNGTSRLRVSMTDAPGDFDEVNVEVVDVKIKNSNDTGEDGWVSIGNITPGVYNLLDLTAGVTVLLADNEVPSGSLRQIRLILGENNTVVKNGVSFDLNTPSAQQSGLKVQLNQTLMPNTTYNLLLDFDVQNSVVVEAGNSGNYNLVPVIRAIAQEAAGSISGIVPPIGFQVMASVVVNGQTVSTYTNEQGNFVLQGIPAGTYSVTLTPDVASGFQPITIDNIVVVNGQTVSMGSLSF